jgi:hypothetical protein
VYQLFATAASKTFAVVTVSCYRLDQMTAQLAHCSSSADFCTYDTCELFKSAALPVLSENALLNTLCMSELWNFDMESSPGTPGVCMALITCNSCINKHSCVVVSSGVKGTGFAQLYVSAAVCPAVATSIAQQLQKLPLVRTIIATTAATALLNAQSGWRVKQQLQLMVHAKPEAAAAITQTAPAEESSCKTRLRQASAAAEEDLCMVYQWVSEFFVEVFSMPEPPATGFIRGLAGPRLAQGLYYVLELPATEAQHQQPHLQQQQQQQGQQQPLVWQPICLAGYVRTSSSSCRITMMFTPPWMRGKGYARIAGKRA